MATDDKYPELGFVGDDDEEEEDDLDDETVLSSHDVQSKRVQSRKRSAPQQRIRRLKVGVSVHRRRF